MRQAISCVISCVSASLILSSPAFSEMPSPAHLLAEKFAQDFEKPTASPPAAPQAISKPAVAKPAPATPVVKRVPPGPDYEKEMLDAARAEAEARKVAQQEPAAPVPAAAATSAPAAAQPATAPAVAAPAAPTAVTAPAAPPAAAAVQAAVKPAAAAVAPPPATVTGSSSHVSVLLALDPQLNAVDLAASQPSPVLCIGDDCYISAGADGPARARTRADAAAGKGATGDCHGKTHCIFRDVNLKPGAELQILDSTFGKPGASKPVEVVPDKSCNVQEGELDCELTTSGIGYRAWIVPESVAAATTPLILESALATDLIEENVSRTDDR